MSSWFLISYCSAIAAIIIVAILCKLRDWFVENTYEAAGIEIQPVSQKPEMLPPQDPSKRPQWAKEQIIPKALRGKATRRNRRYRQQWNNRF